MSAMGVLYVVATPIGNLEDITMRALRVLREARLIAAEDTRTTLKLLSHFDIHTPMVSYFEHNELYRLETILSALQEGDVALVSEAGMPTVSDPGYRLVQEAISRSVTVVPIPGPSAVLSALAVSGLPTDSFLFVGFLPRRRTARQRSLEGLRDLPFTIVCFEAPHRIVDMLSDVLLVLGERRIAVACELTKLYEDVWRGQVGEALEHFSQSKPRGEFTVVIAGAAEEEPPIWEVERVLATLQQLVRSGFSRRDAAASVAAQSGWPKREVYQLSASMKKPQADGTNRA
jgi:16S rRNA (cytidine1402-2'-O)-methyltransferase